MYEVVLLVIVGSLVVCAIVSVLAPWPRVATGAQWLAGAMIVVLILFAVWTMLRMAAQSS